MPEDAPKIPSLTTERLIEIFDTDGPESARAAFTEWCIEEETKVFTSRDTIDFELRKAELLFGVGNYTRVYEILDDLVIGAEISSHEDLMERYRQLVKGLESL